MKLKTSLTVLLVMLFATGCSNTRDEINSLKESGECRMAEQLIKEEYSGQEELYDLALLYSECDEDQNKALKVFKNLASNEYMPAMARLIKLNAASSQMIKRYKILQCQSRINYLSHNRKQKISSIARRWTFAGGKYGRGGMGRAGTEAEIWSDIERSKLAVWNNNEMKLCNPENIGTHSSFQTMPPPFYELGKPANKSTSPTTKNSRSMEIDTRCVQDGGPIMCYDHQSQRYGNN